MSIVKEYIDLTSEYKNIYGEKTIVFLMVGAFYEIYAIKKDNVFCGSSIEDISSMCDLNISNKQATYDNCPVYMCGFRDYTLDKYVMKTTDMGYTCVIFDQEQQGTKYIRKMVAKYSPGTVFLNNNNNLSNNCCCIWFHEHGKQLLIGISCVDILTGKTILYEYTCENNGLPTCYDDLERFISIYKPSELLLISPSTEMTCHIQTIQNLISDKCKHHVIYLNENTIFAERAKKCEKQVYIKELISNTYENLNYDIFSNLFLQNTISSQSFAFLLNFISEHNPFLIKNIQMPQLETFDGNLILANHSLTQLNIISDDNNKKLSSLYNFINYNKTAMGNRKLKEILLHPSSNKEYLNKEYEITDHCIKKSDFCDFIRTTLTGFKDFDKCYRQIILKKITPKTINDLYNNLLSTTNIISYIEKDDELSNYMISDTTSKNIESSSTLRDYIKRIFNLDNCSNVDSQSIEVNIFNAGIFSNLDDHLEILDSCEKEISSIMNNINEIMNNAENKKKPIEYVKIHTTDKSGMYIVTTKKRAELFKSLDKNNLYSIRKTAANNQYTIENSKINNLCDKFFKGKIKLKDIIQSCYLEILCELENYSTIIYELSKFIANIDMLQNRVYIANKFNYSRPVINDESDKSYLDVKNIRHPLIEHIQQNELYVSNDISLGNNDQNGVCLFGTNAVGKTSLIKSIGMNIILAQSGFYTASSSFIYSPYTQLFTRILNNDNMFKGLSTFAVEMCELRTIIKMANKNSLILGDELCSGTENISAISIFIAGLKTLHNNESSFIFATHFHEITNMSHVHNLKKLQMKHLSVYYDTELGSLIYDRKIKDGPGESIYGLEVCKSLMMPDDFLLDAYEIRKDYLKQKDILDSTKSSYNAKKIKKKLCEICKTNNASEIHHLQYQKNANNNNYINDFHKNHNANLISICIDCHNNIHDNNIQYVKKQSTSGKLNLIAL